MPTADENAEAAGWNPDDGPAPNEHNAPVDGLDADDDLNALVARVAEQQARS